MAINILEIYRKSDIKEVERYDLLTEDEKRIAIELLNQATADDFVEISMHIKGFMSWKKHRIIMGSIKKDPFVTDELIVKAKNHVEGEQK